MPCLYTHTRYTCWPVDIKNTGAMWRWEAGFSEHNVVIPQPDHSCLQLGPLALWQTDGLIKSISSLSSYPRAQVIHNGSWGNPDQYTSDVFSRLWATFWMEPPSPPHVLEASFFDWLFVLIVYDWHLISDQIKKIHQVAAMSACLLCSCVSGGCSFRTAVVGPQF